MKKEGVEVLDYRGLKCPLPVLKIRNRLSKMNKGEKIWVWCDDPLVTIDVPNFCNETEHNLKEQESGDNDSYWFLIEV